MAAPARWLVSLMLAFVPEGPALAQAPAIGILPVSSGTSPVRLSLPVVDRRGSAAPAGDEPVQAMIEKTPLDDGSQRLTISYTADTNRQYIVEFRDNLGFTNACDRWQQYPRAPHNTAVHHRDQHLPPPLLPPAFP